MNVLVATISVLPRPDSNGKITNRKYEINIQNANTQPIDAVHTNESIIKAYARINVKIDKIIALCSDAVLNVPNANFDNQTAFEYYAQQAKNLFEGVVLQHIPIENRKNSQILDDICNEISPNDVVYLDIAGGQRTIANIIQLLTKILQYKGIQNPLSLYSDIQNKNNFIVDTHEFTVMTNIADAINEFVTTGKSNQLNQYLKFLPDFKELLAAMNDFSEKIMLCNIGKLEETLSSLKKAIEKLRNDKTMPSIEHTIIKQLIPIIQDKLYVNQDKINYKQIIKWCLDNGLIQQATTIYIEKIPVDYFDKGILNGYVDLESVTPKLGNSKETAGFYEDLFDKFAGNNVDDNLAEFQVFVRNVINNDFEILPKMLLKRITENQQNLRGKILFASNRLKNFIKIHYNLPKPTKGIFYTLNAPKNLSGFLHNLLSTPEYHHYFVYNDPKKWNEIKDIPNMGTYEKKSRALQKVKPQNIKLFALMAHYLAVKLLRNRMNHASVGEEWTSDETIAVKYLESEGFDIKFSITAITKIINEGIMLGE